MLLNSQEKPFPCGGHVTLTDQVPVGYLTSPNYPQNYPVNTDCNWVITAPASESVQVDFIEAFDIENHGK